MRAHWNILRLEFKRAMKRLPHMAAGAAVLMAMLGIIAFAASRILYGETVLGRISVGVVLPKEDTMAQMAVRMLGSLDSVDSLCDFVFMEEEEAEEAFETGQVMGIMQVPEGMVEGIMDGSNPPVSILLAAGGLESVVFRELTLAGARTLGAAQAGIYAGNQLLKAAGWQEQIPKLEEDLNKIYLSYSLPRANYFRRELVQASGDVDSLPFYGVSALVLFLLLEVIPVSGYLTGESCCLEQKLKLLGVGPLWLRFAKTAGLGLLLMASGLIFCGGAWGLGLFHFSWAALLSLCFMCILAASMSLFFYECTKSLMGLVMFLTSASMILLFLSGGMVPSIFLPQGIRRISAFLPTTRMLECGISLVLGKADWAAWMKTAGYGAVFWILAAGVRRR